MVAQDAGAEREPMTVADIARRYRRTQRSVRETWVNSPEWSRTVRAVGKQGHWVLYDAGGVEEFARERVWLPPRDSGVPPDRLLDQRAIAAYTGIDYSSVRAEISRGRLGEPDEVRDGVRLWSRRRVDAGFWARKRRGKRA